VNRATLPPRIVIYGDHGLGKTTFGAAAPNPIVLRTEDGLAGIRVPTFPIARSFGDIVNAINSLLSQPNHFQTFVLDSLDWTEPLVWAHTAFMGTKENIEDFGYGKGFKLADEHWRTLLDGLNALRANGMAVILIAHATVKRFNAPDTDPYDRYQLKLHERAAGLVQEWADVVGFVHLETNTVTKDAGFNQKTTRGVTTGRRLLSLEERPAFEAKNRFGMPAEIEFPRTGAWDLFAQACAGAYATPDDEPAAAADAPILTAGATANDSVPSEEELEREPVGRLIRSCSTLAAGISPGGRHHHQASD
jgi:hypothetical protein